MKIPQKDMRGQKVPKRLSKVFERLPKLRKLVTEYTAKILDKAPHSVCEGCSGRGTIGGKKHRGCRGKGYLTFAEAKTAMFSTTRNSNGAASAAGTTK